MSNRSNGSKDSVQVLNINSDFTTGQHMYRVDLAMNASESKTPPSTMVPFSQTNVPYWRPALIVWLPEGEWKDQYQVGQKYDFVMNETGDLTLKKSEKK
jgi:hypothetical protein